MENDKVERFWDTVSFSLHPTFASALLGNTEQTESALKSTKNVKKHRHHQV